MRADFIEAKRQILPREKAEYTTAILFRSLATRHVAKREGTIYVYMTATSLRFIPRQHLQTGADSPMSVPRF
jgi:hypothetical protein